MFAGLPDALLIVGSGTLISLAVSAFCKEWGDTYCPYKALMLVALASSAGLLSAIFVATWLAPISSAFR